MGQVQFEIDKEALQPERLREILSGLQNSAEGRAYFEIPGKNIKFLLTDNPKSTSLKEGNQKNLAKAGVRITGEGSSRDVAGPQAGLHQKAGAGKPDTIFLNPNNDAEKPPENVIIHEVGHEKWPGLGKDENHHDPLFYKLYGNVLKKFGITPDVGYDYNDRDPSNTPDPPAPYDPLTYIHKPAQKAPTVNKAKPDKRSELPPEGLRHYEGAIVASIGPNVVWTPMGSALVPVAYHQIGFFNDSHQTSSSVRFRGRRAFTMASYITKSEGDAAGTRGGVKSGTTSARCHPIESSDSVCAEKHLVIRDGDRFTMNDGNCVGRAFFQATARPTKPDDDIPIA